MVSRHFVALLPFKSWHSLDYSFQLLYCSISCLSAIILRLVLRWSINTSGIQYFITANFLLSLKYSHDNYWSKYILSRQSKYNYNSKSCKALSKLKRTLNVASRGEWQLDQVNSTNTSPPPKGTIWRKLPQSTIYWNFSWVVCIVVYLVTFFSFAQAMVF